MNKIKYLKDFAASLGCTLVEKGEVGFGRPCVGIIKEEIECYLDINPYDFERDMPLNNDKEEELEDYYIFGYNENLEPDYQLTPNAYHKHSCLSVLVHNEDYDKAISELYEWVIKIQSKGEVEVRKHSEVDLESLDEIARIFAAPYGLALVYKEE